MIALLGKRKTLMNLKKKQILDDAEDKLSRVKANPDFTPELLND
jgi:hypothetical protein